MRKVKSSAVNPEGRKVYCRRPAALMYTIIYMAPYISQICSPGLQITTRPEFGAQGFISQIPILNQANVKRHKAIP